MPQAVVHVLFTIIVLDLFRDHFLKNKRSMPLHYVFIGGVAGLLPDIDIPLYWIVKYTLGIEVAWFHRTLTHSIFFPLAFLVIALVLFDFKKRLGKIFAIISFGTAFHIFLDWIFTGMILPLYPFSDMGVGIDLIGRLGIPLAMEGLEAIVLLWWLWHEEKTHKISDFI